MKTKNFYLDEIKDFLKYCNNPTEFDFVKVMTIIDEFLESQKIKCVFIDINIYNRNIIYFFAWLVNSLQCFFLEYLRINRFEHIYVQNIK